MFPRLRGDANRANLSLVEAVLLGKPADWQLNASGCSDSLASRTDG